MGDPHATAQSGAKEPLWFRISWPILKWTFLGLAATALVLDALIIVGAWRR